MSLVRSLPPLQSLATSAACFILLCLLSASAEGIEIDYAVDSMPRLVVPEEVVLFHARLRPLWLSALERPETELKRQAAMAFAKAARMGMNDLEGVEAALIKAFSQKDSHEVVKLSAARTLIEINARDAAPLLAAEAKKAGLETQLVVEPALASWKHEPYYEVWLLRLKEGARPRELLLAIAAAEAAEIKAASDDLLRLSADLSQGVDIRLAAAKAAGKLSPAGREEQAKSLLADKSPAGLINRLVAAHWLRHHSGDTAIELLLEIIADPEAAVAAIGLERLLEIDPDLVAPHNEKLAPHADARIRGLMVKILQGQETAQAVVLLGILLDDLNPAIRSSAQQALIDLAAIEALDKPVRAAAVKRLAEGNWRGLEQASIVLGALDHEPAAERLVELLSHENEKVYITAAWALRKLAVAETGAAILARFEKMTSDGIALQASIDKQFKTDPQKTIHFEPRQPLVKQMEHLIAALGVLKQAGAIDQFRRYFPTPPIAGPTDPPRVNPTWEPRLRASVFWSLGMMYDSADPELTKLLAANLHNIILSLDERTSAAVALGRMDAKENEKDLRQWSGESAPYPPLERACSWSLNKLTGEPIPEIKGREVTQMGWFLEPALD